MLLIAARSQRWLLFSLWTLLFGSCCSVFAQGRFEMPWVDGRFVASPGAVQFSPDRSLVRSGSYVSRTSDGNYVRNASPPGLTVYSSWFVGAGDMIACCSKTFVNGSDLTQVDFVRISDGKIIRTLQGGSIGSAIVTAASEDGKYFACLGSGNQISLFRVSDGVLVRTFHGTAQTPTVLAVSPGGVYVAAANSFKSVDLWKTSDASLIPTPGRHDDAITCLAFSPDGKLLASGSKDDTVKLWKTQDGTPLPSLVGHYNDILSISFSPDSTQVLTGSADLTIKGWDAYHGTLLRTLAGHNSPVATAVFSKDGQSIYSAAASDGLFKWRVSDGVLTNVRWPLGGGGALSPNGEFIAGIGIDGALVLRNAVSGAFVRRFEGSAYPPFIFSPDGKTISAAAAKPYFASIPTPEIHFWNVQDGTAMKTLQVVADWHQDKYAYSPNGESIAVPVKRFASNGDTITSAAIVLQRLSDGATIRTFTKPNVVFFNPIFLPDGKTIRAMGTSMSDASANTSVYCVSWNIADGTELSSFQVSSIYNLASVFSKDGSMIAVASSGGGVSVLNVETSAVVLSLPVGDSAYIPGFAFSPDRSTLITQRDNGKFQFWRISDGALLREFSDDRVPTSPFISFTYTPDGRRIYFSGDVLGFAKAPNSGNTIFLQNDLTGAVHYWKTRNAGLVSDGSLWNGGDKSWQAVGTPDLNGDGVPDLLFQYSGSDKPHVWILNSDQTAIASEGDLTVNGVVVGPQPGWKVVAIADLNRDGKSDFLLQNSDTGAVYYWLMDGTSIIGKGLVWNGSRDYRLFAAVDTDGDGIPNLLYQQVSTGNLYQQTLDLSGIKPFSAGTYYVWNGGASDLVAQSAINPNSDGAVQVIFKQPSTGKVSSLTIVDGQAQASGLLWPNSLANWELKGLTDLTGDGQRDALWQNKLDGSVYYWGLNGMSIASQGTIFSAAGLQHWKVIPTQ